MLRDKRLMKSFATKLAEFSEVPRPELVGHSRDVQELHKLHVTLTHLLRVTARNYSIPIPLGPLYPAEMMAIDAAEVELTELDDDIMLAMKTTAIPRKTWKEAHA